MFSPMGSFMTELYPTAVRGAGQGFCYNAGRGIGALFPALVGFLATRLGLAVAIAIFSLAAYGIMIVALLLLPETRGRSLLEPGAAGGGVGRRDPASRRNRRRDQLTAASGFLAKHGSLKESGPCCPDSRGSPH